MLSAAVEAAMLLMPGSLGLGAIFFDTALNANPAIYANTTRVMGFDSTSTVTFVAPPNSSGGAINLIGPLTFAEVPGHSSGAVVLENSINEPILCNSVVLDVLTMTGTTKIDIYAGTGSIAESSDHKGAGTGSTLIANDWTITTGTHTMTGSGISYNESGSALIAGLRIHIPKFFKLYGNSSSSSINQINVNASGNGSGQLVTGTIAATCIRLK